MKRSRPAKGRGGIRPGAGRKPGSIRPEKRIELAQAYALRIAEIMREGKGRNAAVQQVYNEAFRADHPELVGDDEHVFYLVPKADPYFKSQKQMRKMGKRDLKRPPGQNLAVFAVEELMKVVVDVLQENGDLKCEASEALEVLRRYFETPEALEALRRERTR
jgi:hypothetical protein